MFCKSTNCFPVTIEGGEDNLVDPNMKKYIDHQIEIITDSDWFEELVKDKVKEVSGENN